MISDPILNLTERYKNHPTILETKTYIEQNNCLLCFEYTKKEKCLIFSGIFNKTNHAKKKIPW